MLTIKTSSIWYKLSNYNILCWNGYNTNAKSLCGLFWRIVFNLSFSFFILGVLGLFIRELIRNTEMRWEVLCGLIMFVLAILGVVLMTAIISYGSEKFNETTDEEHPNVFVEFIKAKKQKVCPLIKWEN